MDAYVSISYQKFYGHLEDYFGKEIKFTFWDEPACILSTPAASAPDEDSGRPVTTFRLALPSVS
jgi:hypothetical protein